MCTVGFFAGWAQNIFIAPVNFPYKSFNTVAVNGFFKIPFWNRNQHFGRITGGCLKRGKEHPEGKGEKRLPIFKKSLHQLLLVKSFLFGESLFQFGLNLLLQKYADLSSAFSSDTKTTMILKLFNGNRLSDTKNTLF